MFATGGSFMQQPNNNSEAVKRCMTIPDAPLSSHLHFQPHPPYAAGKPKQRPRPYSAPQRRQTSSYTVPYYAPKYIEPKNSARHYNVSLMNQRPIDSDISRNAPYAARKIQSFVNSVLGYPTNKDGHHVPISPYDPLTDPHLVEYFERRFGSIQTEAWRRQNMLSDRSRPSSADSYGRVRLLPKRRRLTNGDEDVLYKIVVTTGGLKNSGTDAKVFVRLKGIKGKLPKTRLTKKAGSVKSGKNVAFRFAKGSTHVFKVRGPNIGTLKSVVVETSALKKEEAWYLQEIEVINTKTKKSWHFFCNQWFSLFHGDGQVSRQFFPTQTSKTEYEVVTVTGEKQGAGTNANVFMTLYGKTGTTGKIQLKNTKKTSFQSGSTDTFHFKSSCVGPMVKLRIEHDNTGLAPGWYLERVVVTDLKNPQWKYFFPCGQWLAKDEGDGEICRDLIGSKDPLAIRKASKYKVTVYTGSKSGAGTDANVSVTMFGEFGDSGEKKLSKTRKNCFEKNSVDEFVIQCPKLGRLERVRIGHDNSGFAPGWYLEKVIVDDIDASTVYEFPCQRWLSKSEDDGQVTRELFLNVGPRDMPRGYPFIITVKTGDKVNAGTDAKVYVIMYGGKKGEETSGKVWLQTGRFKRNETDIFNVDVAKMLSPLTKLEVGHDNSGAAPGWFLENVMVYCPATGIEQYFPCHKWLATGEGDGLIQRTLVEQSGMRKTREKQISWQAWVFTSDLANAGTDANVYMVIYGDKGKSDDIPLQNKGDAFEKGHMDTFRFNTNDVGKPYKIRVWHDNSGTFAGWHLDKIELESMEGKERYSFKCGRWLAEDEDDNEVVREIPATAVSIKKALPVVHYVVQVYTGKKTSAGTNANVYINIFGDLGDTGNRWLKHSKTSKDKFERGQVDEFEIEAVTLSKLRKIRIGHDGKGAGSGWFLDKVVISVKDQKEKQGEVTFICQRWLAEDEDDGLIEREITASGAQMLSTTTYHLSVKTGNETGAGTDADVFLRIFGTKGDTGSLQLRQSENSVNKFERGKTDLFKLEAEDIGKIKKIKIGHDNRRPGAAWLLDEVCIDIPSKGEHYIFACHKWLSEKYQLEVELEPSDTQKIEKTIPYEITVWTGSKVSAGTDANVLIQMYGQDGKSQEIKLRNKTDNFEKGQVDKFKVEAPDIGQLQKVRIGHDGKGVMSGWYLEKMLIQKPLPQKKQTARRMSEQNRRKSIISMHQSSDESDSSPTASPGRGRNKNNFKGSKTKLDAVIEEDEEVADTEDYWFFVDKWFSKGEGDKLIVRELIPTDEKGQPLKRALEEVEYTVKVYTGTERYAGTDANVFINIYGEKGDTGERQLKESATNSNKFEEGQEDIFSIKARDLGKLIKLNIRHDNTNLGSDWFLDRVEVYDNKRKINYFFPCQRWLAPSKDDGQLSRDLMPVDPSVKRRSKSGSITAIRDEIALELKAALTTYNVQVYTGDAFGAGTDANVYIILFGEKDHTDKLFLKSSINNSNKFERKQMDEFILELANIGELKKIKIGHDNKGGGSAWLLDKVIIDAKSLGHRWVFPCGHWLSDSDEDRLLERELYPQELATEEYAPHVPYEITTYTSDISSAGTDAMVYVTLYGKDRATQQTNLCTSKRECKDKFNRGQVDKFVIEMDDIGKTIEKLRIGHDGTGFGAGWHLDKVEVRRLRASGKGSVTYTFPCRRWLAKDMEDHAIERELIPVQAIKEITGKDGETKATELKLGEKLAAKKYVVEVYTGNEKNCGTDANVFITLFGDKGDSGERQLRESETNRNKFERNRMDRFVLEARDLGKLYKMKIRHDNSLISPAWFLDRVEVSDGKDKYVFHCERWLAKNKDDGKIERSLYVKGYDGDMVSSTETLTSQRFDGSVTSLSSMKTSPRLFGKQLTTSKEDIPEGPTIPYTIRVSTGDGEDNGTDSNVWIRIYGPKNKQTGRKLLELVQRKRFEPSSVETFSIEALDVGEIKKVEIGHDGVNQKSGWFLNDIEVDLPTKGKHYHFDCKQWLARDKGDGKTVRVFSVDDGMSSITSYKPMVSYEVTVTTADVEGAGTDCKILMTVFGVKGTSVPLELEKREANFFERGRTDLIKMEIEDIAPLKKIRIELVGKGSRPSWNLEKIKLRNLETGSVSVFKYNGWIGRGREGAKNPVDIPATEKGRTVLDKTAYKITVKTSDVRGAGTDANVYVILFGAIGDSGEIHLKKSETYKNPFEQNQKDVFTIENILSLGELSKLRVWHDNTGANNLNYELRTNGCSTMTTRQLTQHSQCPYFVAILKSLSHLAPCNKFQSRQLLITPQVFKKQKETVSLSGYVRREKLKYIVKIGNRGLGSAWHLASIEVQDVKTQKTYTFHCNKWLSKTDDDKQIIRELTCHETARPHSAGDSSGDKTEYEIEVTTSDKSEGGTIHNGWIILEGNKRSSKIFTLMNSAHNKILRKGTTNNFTMHSLPLGKLEHCIVGAFEREDRPIGEAEGREAMWHCHEIRVTDVATGSRYVFPCKKWIQICPRVSKRDGVILDSLKVEESPVKTTCNLALVKYEVVTVTGDMKGAQTNANVFITIYGTNGNTGRHPLKKSFKGLFERTQRSSFQIEALDLGELKKITIEHDNSGFRPDWFLERVEIINMATNYTTVFPCGKWLSKSKGDKEIVRELYAKTE